MNNKDLRDVKLINVELGDNMFVDFVGDHICIGDDTRYGNYSDCSIHLSARQVSKLVDWLYDIHQRLLPVETTHTWDGLKNIHENYCVDAAKRGDE